MSLVRWLRQSALCGMWRHGKKVIVANVDHFDFELQGHDVVVVSKVLPD